MEDTEGIKIERDYRLLDPEETPQESQQVTEPTVNILRPQRFSDYPGQEKAKENLQTYVQASLRRSKEMDHVILHGPPGLGKTTLAHIVASELGAPFCCASGPSIDKPGDLAGILAGLSPGSLIFIDEIHRLSIQVEEVLYSAMEDFTMEVIVGQGATARSVSIPIQPFTLVGATTRLSSLSRPFLNRFGIQERLEYYSEEALCQIIDRSAKILSISIDPYATKALARRSRGTPRISNRLLKRVWDFAEVKGKTEIDCSLVDYALKRLDIDHQGLDHIDQSILRVIEEQYGGGPVGIETLAVTIGEERTTLEEVYEPYLIHSGFMGRSLRGRVITPKGKEHLSQIYEEEKD